MRSGLGGPCCHCGATSSPCWRKGPPEKAILCNACGARYLVKRTLDGYMPGQKVSRLNSTNSRHNSQRSSSPSDSSASQSSSDVQRRKRANTHRYDLEDLYHSKRSKKVNLQPVSITVTAGLPNLLQTPISLWKQADNKEEPAVAAAAQTIRPLEAILGVSTCSNRASGDQQLLPGTLSVLQHNGGVICKAAAATTGAPRHRRKQLRPTAGAWD